MSIFLLHKKEKKHFKIDTWPPNIKRLPKLKFPLSTFPHWEQKKKRVRTFLPHHSCVIVQIAVKKTSVSKCYNIVPQDLHACLSETENMWIYCFFFSSSSSLFVREWSKSGWLEQFKVDVRWLTGCVCLKCENRPVSSPIQDDLASQTIYKSVFMCTCVCVCCVCWFYTKPSSRYIEVLDYKRG